MRQVTNRDPAWRFWSAVVAAVFGTLAILLWVSTAVAVPAPHVKVTVCHAVGGDGGNQHDGYSIITVNVNSVGVANDLNGHAGHSGDIWAPFVYAGVTFAGQGDASLIDTGCVAPPVTCEDENDCPPVTDCNGDTNPDNNGPFGNCDEGVMVCQNGEVQLEPTGTVDDGTCVNIPPPCKPCNPPPPGGGPSTPPVPPAPTLKQYKQDVQNGAEPGGG